MVFTRRLELAYRLRLSSIPLPNRCGRMRARLTTLCLKGFYVYEPVMLPPAATAVAADVMSGADRWKLLHDRINAKERARNARPEPHVQQAEKDRSF